MSDVEGKTALAGADQQGTSRLAQPDEGATEMVEMMTIDGFCVREAIAPTRIEIVEGLESEGECPRPERAR